MSAANIQSNQTIGEAPKVQFLSKKQREEQKKKQEEEEKAKEIERLKEIEQKRNEFLEKSTKSKKRSRSRSRSRERYDRNRRSDRDDYNDRRRQRDGEFDKPRNPNTNKDQKAASTTEGEVSNAIAKTDKMYLIDEKEIDQIRGKYLGTIKDKKKPQKTSDKFRQVFVFEWDASEDTSQDINPLYAQRHDAKILFGKGYMGGADQDEQRKNYDEKGTKKTDENKNYRESLTESYINKTSEEMTDREWRIFREDNDIVIKGGRIPQPVRNWDEIEDIDNIVRDNISACGYARPMPIQMQAIPIGMNFRDMIGIAPTGSGKSVAFLVPLISFLLKMPPIKEDLVQDGPYSIIMAPTRELAIQIDEEFRKLAKETRLRSIIVVGGKSSEEQGSSISRGVEIVIGTPGRIEDLIKRRYLVLNQCYYVVLDEADKMIDLDLEQSVNFILESIPQSLSKSEREKDVSAQETQIKRGEKFYKTFVMFSATMLPQIEKIARKYLRAPAYIQIGEPGGGKKDIDQRVEFVSENAKRSKLQQLLQKYPQPPIMIFVRERTDTEILATYLGKIGYNAATLHGSKTQDQREKALKSLKDGVNDILVCTNVAARGIDIEGVSHVINYHAPGNIIDYIHRIGRTGRAGKKGMATTFVTNADEALLYDLKKFLQDNDQHVPNELANHPAAKFKPGSSEAQIQSGKGSKTVPTSTQHQKQHQ